MWGAFLIISLEPMLKHLPNMSAFVKLVQIHAFVFHYAPQALDEDGVHAAPLAVHGEVNACMLQCLRKIQTCKLTTLVCIEYLGAEGTAFLGGPRIDGRNLPHRAATSGVWRRNARLDAGA